jgi:hypothetical protein
VEECRENEEESGNNSDKENNDPDHIKDGYDDYNDYNDLDDGAMSPPNKLPDSFVESRGSILPSEASSSKNRDTINIFSSDHKEQNRSFQHMPYSNPSSMKKQYPRNVSQKFLNSQERFPLNESNILRERYTDPNNVSNIKSNESITISHKTFNHSNYESEKPQNGIISTTDLAMEKRRAVLEMNSKQKGVQKLSMGSPISMFNPEKKVVMKLDQNENLTLEEMISRIDSRREVFKKSVREELEEYMGIRHSTPQFTESPNSNFLYQSTNDNGTIKTVKDKSFIQQEKGKYYLLNL